jgi:hypothetical protein
MTGLSRKSYGRPATKHQKPNINHQAKHRPQRQQKITHPNSFAPRAAWPLYGLRTSMRAVIAGDLDKVADKAANRAASKGCQ